MMVLEVVHKWITQSTGCGARGAVDSYAHPTKRTGFRGTMENARRDCDISTGGHHIPTKEAVMTFPDSTATPTAVDKIREYLRFTEGQLVELLDKPESAVWHYYSGAATAAHACLMYLGVDD